MVTTPPSPKPQGNVSAGSCLSRSLGCFGEYAGSEPAKLQPDLCLLLFSFFYLLPPVPDPESTASAQGWIVRGCSHLCGCCCSSAVAGGSCSFFDVSWANEVSTLTGQGFESWRNPGAAFFLCPICSAWIVGCMKSVKSLQKEASSPWLIQKSKVQMRNEERGKKPQLCYSPCSLNLLKRCVSPAL